MRLKIIDYLQVELEIPKISFVNRLREHVDDGSIGALSDPFEAFSSSNNDYKGKVDSLGFKIKRRRKLFDMNIDMAVASGTYIQKDNLLIINAEINGFHVMMIPFYIFCFIFYCLIIFSFIFSDNFGGGIPVFVLPFILIHACMMLGIPYLMMRRGTKQLKRELEREFFFITK